MAARVLSWVSVAGGACIGAILGFHDARPAAAQHTTAPSKTALRARAAVVPVHATTSPVLVATRPTLPAAATSTLPQLDVGESASQALAAAADGKATARSVTPPEPPKVTRAPQPRAKPAQARPMAPPTARFSDPPVDQELRDPRAVFRAESACARRDPEQCLRAARAFRVGVATKPNQRTASIYWHSAQRIYEERCKQREPLSYIGLAAMYEKGPGTQPTYAPDLVEHARGICNHRFQEHCDELDAERERLRGLMQGLDKPQVDEAP